MCIYKSRKNVIINIMMLFFNTKNFSIFNGDFTFKNEFVLSKIQLNKSSPSWNIKISSVGFSITEKRFLKSSLADPSISIKSDTATSIRTCRVYNPLLHQTSKDPYIYAGNGQWQDD